MEVTLVDALGDDLETADARARVEEERRGLRVTLEDVPDTNGRFEVELRRARLELTPRVGRPEEALAVCDRLLWTSGSAEGRAQARRLRLVALALSGRYVDAERLAKEEAATAGPADLIALARLLDATAAAHESDLTRRRLGSILRTILAPLASRRDTLDERDRREVSLRQARASLFGGDPDGARAELGRAKEDLSVQRLDQRLVRDLADLLAGLGLHHDAVDAYRRLAKQSESGSRGWFEARYGLALSLSREGKRKEARRLIEGTAVLHPELGGGELRRKFDRLLQRL